VELRLLELAAKEYAFREPQDYNLPPKTGRVAIIGAGAAGLACAVRLASKNYDVTVYERSESAGGKLRELLPEEILEEEIRRDSMYAPYALVLGKEVISLTRLCADAVYIARARRERTSAI
jgi:NADPH-dependent glutamate synthase beta subunit-like oxidoreductase